MEPFHLFYEDSQDQYHPKSCITVLTPMASMLLICPHLFKFSPSCCDAKSTLEQGHISSLFGLPTINLVPCIGSKLLDVAETNAAL